MVIDNSLPIFLEHTNPILFDIPNGFKIKPKNTPKDIDKLYFPKEIYPNDG